MLRIFTWFLLVLLASVALAEDTSFTECRVHIEAALDQYAKQHDKQVLDDESSSKSSIEVETQIDEVSVEKPESVEAEVKIEEPPSEDTASSETPVAQDASEEAAVIEEAPSSSSEEGSAEEPAIAQDESVIAEEQVAQVEEAPAEEEKSAESVEEVQASESEETVTEGESKSTEEAATESESKSAEEVKEVDASEEEQAVEEPTEEQVAEEPSKEEVTEEHSGEEEVIEESTSEEEQTPVVEEAGESGEDDSSEETLQVVSPSSTHKPLGDKQEDSSEEDKSDEDSSEEDAKEGTTKEKEDESEEDKDDSSEEDDVKNMSSKKRKVKDSSEDIKQKQSTKKSRKEVEDDDESSEIKQKPSKKKTKKKKSQEDDDSSEDVKQKPRKKKSKKEESEESGEESEEDESSEDVKQKPSKKKSKKEETEEDESSEEDDDSKDDIKQKLRRKRKPKKDESEEDESEEEEAVEPELEAVDEESEPAPAHVRPREHVDRLLGVDETSSEINELTQQVARGTLKDLKKVYDSSIKPLEAVYKYRDISTRHLGDPELYSKSMILVIGPWGSGKSTFCNYLLGNEFSERALKTGSQPGRGFVNIIEFGETQAVLDGTELVAQWEFSSLQKFGQAFLQHLQGHRMPNRLLEKVTFVDMPGIIERGKQSEREYPFNDVCQWFIDRSDLILVMFDPTRLDAGLEIEALFDQLKGRETQVRIVLNKADLVRPQDLMRVQGNLFWALSPLLGSTEPPIIYAGSFWSRLYRPGAPIRLFRAQEEALLLDIRDAFESRVENRIALTRRHAVRVRNHAKMVDCYLTTFYSQKSFFANKKKVAGEIVDNPGEYRIYEGISTLTNVSRYDLPDPDIYRDFFRLHPLYDFPTLHSTCTFFRGCPLDKLDIAISYDLPELLGKHRKQQEQALLKGTGH